MMIERFSDDRDVDCDQMGAAVVAADTGLTSLLTGRVTIDRRDYKKSDQSHRSLWADLRSMSRSCAGWLTRCQQQQPIGQFC
jgi:hypothetical protein